MKRSRKKKKDIAAEQLGAIHDADVKMPEHTDELPSQRRRLEIRRVKVGFPQWMIDRMDREAEMIGITRQTIIKFWIAERLDASAKTIA
jgi:hypothetical protein